jgi:hypothetical protein
MALAASVDLAKTSREPKGGLMNEVQTATIQTDVPVRLLAEMQTLVEAGWFRDLDELMLDALRRFVESHRAELMERFIREDVEWGLHGDEMGGKEG